MAPFKSLIIAFVGILLTACASPPLQPNTPASGTAVSVQFPGGCCGLPPQKWKKEPLLSGDERDCAWFGGEGLLKTVFTDESGSRLDLYCHEREYALLFVASGGYWRQVGRCPWGGGSNEADITHTDDRRDPAGVDCMLSIFWRSEEPWMPILGYPQGDRYQIDWKEFLYLACEDRLILRHFKSTDGPGGEMPDTLVKKKTSHGDAITEDILNFNPAAPLNKRPMHTIKRPLCDIDRDGDCDAGDLDVVRALIGECEDGQGFNALADVDHDGCISFVDYDISSLLCTDTAR